MKTKNDGEQLLRADPVFYAVERTHRHRHDFNEAFVCNLLSRQDAAQPLTATDLCQRTKLLKSQMNKVLSEMERKGYIQRIRSEKDKRQVLLHLTEARAGRLCKGTQRHFSDPAPPGGGSWRRESPARGRYRRGDHPVSEKDRNTIKSGVLGKETL